MSPTNSLVAALTSCHVPQHVTVVGRNWVHPAPEVQVIALPEGAASQVVREAQGVQLATALRVLLTLFPLQKFPFPAVFLDLVRSQDLGICFLNFLLKSYFYLTDLFKQNYMSY